MSVLVLGARLERLRCLDKEYLTLKKVQVSSVRHVYVPCINYDVLRFNSRTKESFAV